MTTSGSPTFRTPKCPSCSSGGSGTRPATAGPTPTTSPAPSWRSSALVAACDEFAYDLIRAAASLGLEVGGGAGEIAVVGCDDSALAERTVPTLTSLRQPIQRIAERVVDLLAAKIATPRFEAHVLERPELIVRESSSAAGHRP